MILNDSMAVEDFQNLLLSDYMSSLKISSNYRFLDGTPLLPVVPVETHRRGIMIIGAYPTADFETVDGEPTVPVADIARPFDENTKSGRELQGFYLGPLKIPRSKCWITNLVKCFLFKPGHIEKYDRLNAQYVPKDYYSEYEELAGSKANLNWLDKELAIVSPKLVITLGAVVAGILRPDVEKFHRNSLLNGELQQFTRDDKAFNVIHFAHPGIIMRREQEHNPWPRLHRDVHIPAAEKVIEALFPEFLAKALE